LDFFLIYILLYYYYINKYKLGWTRPTIWAGLKRVQPNRPFFLWDGPGLAILLGCNGSSPRSTWSLAQPNNHVNYNSFPVCRIRWNKLVGGRRSLHGAGGDATSITGLECRGWWWWCWWREWRLGLVVEGEDEKTYKGERELCGGCSSCEVVG